jgi:hypothetical protein
MGSSERVNHAVGPTFLPARHASVNAGTQHQACQPVRDTAFRDSPSELDRTHVPRPAIEAIDRATLRAASSEELRVDAALHAE